MATFHKASLLTVPHPGSRVALLKKHLSASNRVEREMQCYELSAVLPSNSVIGIWTFSGQIVKAACTLYEYINRSNRARYQVGGSNQER